MNNTPKRHLWPLSRGHHKCRVQMSFLVPVSIKLKIYTILCQELKSRNLQSNCAKRSEKDM